jgi:hypothetical protein
MKTVRFRKGIVLALGILLVLALLCVVLRRPSALLTPYVIRTPLRSLVSYSWNISAENGQKVRARMYFPDDQCSLRIDGNGAMMDLYTGTADFAWRKFMTMSVGWTVSITEVSISEGVKSIGAYAFAGCIDLGSVEIADTVACIGSYAFSQCRALDQIVYGGSMEEWRKITLQPNWLAGKESIQIVCSDGILIETTGGTDRE